MFLEEWTEKLKEAEMLGEEAPLIITKDNLVDLLQLLDIEKVVKVEDGCHLLDFHENGHAPFEKYYRDLVNFIYKASLQQ